MTEIISIFHKDNLQTPVCVEREDFYLNRRTKYEQYYTQVVDLFVFNKYGEALVQKRSKKKE